MEEALSCSWPDVEPRKKMLHIVAGNVEMVFSGSGGNDYEIVLNNSDLEGRSRRSIQRALEDIP